MELGWPTSDQLLALVAVITAVANAVSTVVHSFRVPYRESDKAEETHAVGERIRLRASYPPPPPDELEQPSTKVSKPSVP